MKRQDIEMILDNFKREEYPSLINIASESTLHYNIPTIERKIRSDDMYTLWREHEKRYENATSDVIEQLDTKELKRTKVELHHVVTLYDVCYVTGLKLLEENGKTDAYEITKHVLIDHLLGIVAYVPLLISNHQKLHDNLIKIDKTKIKGDYEKWLEKYKKYVTKDMIDKLK